MNHTARNESVHVVDQYYLRIKWLHTVATLKHYISLS